MKELPDLAALDYDALAPAHNLAEEAGVPWITPEQVALAPSYPAAAIAGLPHLGGVPGVAPFVRGPYATMYTRRPWTIRQYDGFSTEEASNAFYRENL
ncbi:MAG: methylmalonyl-CoA mutase, partial [Myxococcales bacterium]|nr:methylmalonyl-CoA mutase [Myxococcales bacterium]